MKTMLKRIRSVLVLTLMYSTFAFGVTAFAETAATPSNAEVLKMYTTTSVHLRQSPSTESIVLDTLPACTEIVITDTLDGWYKVTTSNCDEAYIKSEYLSTEIVNQNVYSSIFANTSSDDIYLLAQLVYQEARGESNAGQRAVIEIVLNRVLSPKFPNSIRGVIYQKGEFSTRSLLKGTKPFQKQFDNIEFVKNNGNIQLSTNYLYFSTRKMSYATGYTKIDHQWFGRPKR